MDSTSVPTSASASPIARIIATTKAVITEPRAFFRSMPRSGGFIDPLIFTVVLSIASALVAIPIWLLGVGPYSAFPGVVFSFVIAPALTGIFSFAGAGVMFAIWHFLGSRESYETAYRCSAYITAVSPFAVIASIVPYLGGIAMVIWGFYLTVIASEEVHGIERRKARLAFGAAAVVFSLMSISSQRAAQVMQERSEAVNEKLRSLDQMSPEEAGKAVGEFMKGLQGAVEDKPTGDKPPE